MNTKQKMITGGCLCGSVKYEIHSEPLTVYACHCSDCQTASGSSFVLAMRVPPNSVIVTQGEPLETIRPREDGRKKKIFRCPECLSALWGEKIDSPQYSTVYVGTLDDSKEYEPVGHIWISDAQEWIKFLDSCMAFDRNPPSMKMFEEEWMKRINA